MSELNDEVLRQEASRFNPQRLDLARRRRGLTKVLLADKIGISTRMLTAYEEGEKPSPNTLSKIGEVLQFPIEFFSGGHLDEPPVESASFRALSNLTAKQRDQALALGTLAIALSDWINAQFKLPDTTVPQFRGIDPETAAMAMRTEWGFGERSIRNMVHLLESHGVRVFSLSKECADVDAFSFWRGQIPYVFLNTLKSAERSRMDAAHELGHLVLHWNGALRRRDTEREADLFGSAFLMPRGSVLAMAPRHARLDQLIAAKRYWDVSVANLVYRMHMLGLLTDWQYRTLFVEISRLGYRTNEPNGAQPEISQVLTKVFKALRDEGVTMSQVANKMRIPVDELNNIVFGLVLTPLIGNGSLLEEKRSSGNGPTLRLV